MAGFRKPENGDSETPNKGKDKKDMSAYERWEAPAVAEGNASELQEVVAGAGYKFQGIKPPTAHDLEEIRKKAYEEGFKEGKDKGFVAGHDLGEKKGEEEKLAEAALLAQVVRALMQPIDQQDQELEKVLLSMVMHICKLILKRELKIDSSQVMQIVREALVTLNCGSKTIKILLHPNDIAQILPEIRKLPDYHESWRIVEQAGLSPGGCIVESSEGLVDASVDQRVEQLVAQIYEEKIMTDHARDKKDMRSEPKSDFLDEEGSNGISGNSDSPSE